MATKKFTKHAQRVLNHNPNVVKCTEAKITFTEEFAQKVLDALKAGEDPYAVFEENGLSLRILGKSRVNGAIGLWKSRFGLEDLPRRKPEAKPKKEAETASERREKNLAAAIAACDKLIANPQELSLPEGSDNDTIHFAAIKKVYDSKMSVIVKDLCSHYGYPYSKYYAYLQSQKPKDEYVNLLNPHHRAK
ncbi:MAG: hypothetical protein PUA93_02685 [Eubacteriales bacterium]|nr:hypothetical protein [Eubacteriales bacterium]